MVEETRHESQIVDEIESSCVYSFNEDASVIIVGNLSGFKMYSIEPFKLVLENEGGYKIVEIIKKSPLVMLVGAGETANMSPRVLRLKSLRTNELLAEKSLDDCIAKVVPNVEVVILHVSKPLAVDFSR